MLCPQCNAEIPDDSVICRYCDAILDDAYFAASGGTDEVETQPRARVEKVNPNAAPTDPNQPPVGAAPMSTRILQLDPEREKETRIVRVSDLPTRRAPGTGRAALDPEAEEEAGDLWARVSLSYRRLRPADKLALWCMLALFVSVFLPWFNIRGEGFVSGIERRGVLAAIFAGLAMAVFWIRVSLRWILLVLLQIAFIVGAALVAGYVLLNPDNAPRSFGLYVTLGAGTAAVITSLLGAIKQ